MPFKRRSASQSSLSAKHHSEMYGPQDSVGRKRRGSWSDSLKARLHKWSAPRNGSKTEDPQHIRPSTSVPTILGRSRSSTGSDTHRSTEERAPLRRKSMSDLQSTDRHSGPYKYTQDRVQEPKITFIEFKHTPSKEDISDLAQQISTEANADLRPGSGRVDVIVVDSMGGHPRFEDSQGYQEEYPQQRRIGDRRVSAFRQSGRSLSEADWRDMQDPAGTSYHPVIPKAWPSQVTDPVPPHQLSMPNASHYPITESTSSIWPMRTRHPPSVCGGSFYRRLRTKMCRFGFLRRSVQPTSCAMRTCWG